MTASWVGGPLVNSLADDQWFKTMLDGLTEAVGQPCSSSKLTKPGRPIHDRSIKRILGSTRDPSDRILVKLIHRVNAITVRVDLVIT